MRPKSNPVRISSSEFTLLLQGYRQALFEYKINLKVTEIEDCILNKNSYKPKSNLKKYLKIHNSEDALPDNKIQ